MEWSEMSPAFRDKTDIIYEHLTSKLKPMGVKGCIFDGSLLEAYIENLVAKINSDTIPTIENTYTYIC